MCFIQLHMITSHPSGVLLNRDEAGMAKSLTIGGVERTRISSQCVKRLVGTGEDILALDTPKTVRSRATFKTLIALPLVAEGFDIQKVIDTVAVLRALVLGEKPKVEKEAAPKGKRGAAKTEEAKEAPKLALDDLATKQLVVLGYPEVEALKDLARKALKGEIVLNEKTATLTAIRRATGIGAAMFGRMVTSDLLARADSSVHVAHAFTVHAAVSEPDFFSAVGDTLPGDEGQMTSSEHIGLVDLTSCTFYQYVVIDVRQLAANLTGYDRREALNHLTPEDKQLMTEIIRALVRAFATSTGAKKGSTAPYAVASSVLATAGTGSPFSLAEAFLTPVPPKAVHTAGVVMYQHLHDVLARYPQELSMAYFGVGTDDAGITINDIGDAMVRAALGVE